MRVQPGRKVGLIAARRTGRLKNLNKTRSKTFLLNDVLIILFFDNQMHFRLQVVCIN